MSGRYQTVYCCSLHHRKSDSPSFSLDSVNMNTSCWFVSVCTASFSLAHLTHSHWSNGSLSKVRAHPNVKKCWAFGGHNLRPICAAIEIWRYLSQFTKNLYKILKFCSLLWIPPRVQILGKSVKRCEKYSLISTPIM